MFYLTNALNQAMRVFIAHDFRIPRAISVMRKYLLWYSKHAPSRKNTKQKLMATECAGFWNIPVCALYNITSFCTYTERFKQVTATNNRLKRFSLTAYARMSRHIELHTTVKRACMVCKLCVSCFTQKCRVSETRLRWYCWSGGLMKLFQ